jgi:alcohol dehydrogenase class IV
MSGLGHPAQFRAGTRIVIGQGCLHDGLGAELDRLTHGAGPVAVVAERGLMESGVLEALLADCDSSRLTLCAGIGVDPDVAAAEAAAQEALERGAGAVLTIGGGSALCAGKAVAIRLTNPSRLDAYQGRDRLARLPAPTIAVPTTAGSGSEVSTVVVLHDADHPQHLVIRGEGYEPDVAMLDGSVLRSLPSRPMIEAALDALSHCYEALWARRATAVTDALALAAARTIRTSLPRALERSDPHMQELIVASAMANLACGNAEMGLVHALTSAPGVHLPHGYQNGVLLPWVAEFNGPALTDDVRREIATLGAFYEELGFDPRFSAGELSVADSELMISAALRNPFLANNRRSADEADLRRVLAAAGAPLRG